MQCRTGITSPVVGARVIAGRLIQMARDGLQGTTSNRTKTSANPPPPPLFNPEAFMLETRAAQLSLHKQGFDSWVVGAGVRDYLLLGTVIAPVEILTSAPAQVFEEVRVLAGRTRVRAYPADLDYLARYLERSDFTVCAVAVNLITGEVRDPYGGVADARDRTLNTVRRAQQHLAEQPAAVVRALRHQASYGLTLRPSLAEAIHKFAMAPQEFDAATHRRLTSEVFRAVRLSSGVTARLVKALTAPVPFTNKERYTVLQAVLPRLDAAVQNMIGCTFYGDKDATPIPEAMRTTLWASLVANAPREGRIARSAALLLPLVMDPTETDWDSVARTVLRDSGYVSLTQSREVLRVLDIVDGDYGQHRSFAEVRRLVTQYGEDAVFFAFQLLDLREKLWREPLGARPYEGPSRVEILEAAQADETEGPSVLTEVSCTQVELAEVHAALKEAQESLARDAQEVIAVTPNEVRVALRLDLEADSLLWQTLLTYVEGKTLSNDPQSLIEGARDLAVALKLVEFTLPGGIVAEEVLQSYDVPKEVAAHAHREVFWKVRMGELETREAVELALLDVAASMM